MKRIFLLLAMVACVAPAMAERGALTVPRNLEQLTDRSAWIVRGTVVSARVEAVIGRLRPGESGGKEHRSISTQGEGEVRS